MRNRFLHSSIALVCTITLVGIAFIAGVTAVLRTHRLSAVGGAYPAKISLTADSLSAKAAIIYDPTDGRVLYAKHADQALPLASLTKLMTAEIVLKSQSPSTRVDITEHDLAPYGDWGLKVGDTITLGSLLRLGLIASSNDAMAAAASSLGPNYLSDMNQVAHNLGLSQTHFNNPTGLDISTTTAGAYGSAYDVARLAALFFAQYPSYFELTQKSSVSIDDTGRTLKAHATAAPLLATPGFLGAKTGYTDLAGGTLVALFDVEIGHPLVAVVLGSTQDGRFTDIEALITAARHANN